MAACWLIERLIDLWLIERFAGPWLILRLHRHHRWFWNIDLRWIDRQWCWRCRCRLGRWCKWRSRVGWEAHDRIGRESFGFGLGRCRWGQQGTVGRFVLGLRQGA